MSVCDTDLAYGLANLADGLWKVITVEDEEDGCQSRALALEHYFGWVAQW